MGKISDKFTNWMKNKYARKNIQWERSDSIVWGFWTKVFPYIVWIPLLFWLLKKLMIDYLLAKKGFEETIIFIAIMIIIKPLIMETLTKIVTLKDQF